MSQVQPINTSEKKFSTLASSELPAAAEVERNDHGLLTYFWPSRCDEVGGLWASVSEDEVFLATKSFHTHLNRQDMIRFGQLDPASYKDHIDISISRIADILNGKLVFSRSYYPNGQMHSSGMGRRDMLAEDLAHRERVFGPEISTKFWDWFGEVVPPC